MRYAKLGDSGLIVSRLAFGAMTLGTNWTGPLAAFDGVDAERMVHRALDAGINLFDTADVYHQGESETLLGTALAARRGDAIIATKVGMQFDQGLANAGLSARHIMRSIDASLGRLRSDWIDLYICHRPDHLTPLEETLQALDAVVRDGKARYIGFSNWPAWLAAKAICLQRANGWARFVAGQMYYSLIARDIENDYIPMAEDCGLGTMVWSPLSSGFLSGKYSRANLGGEEGRLAKLDLLPFDHQRGHEIVDILKRVADDRGVPLAAVALAWVIAQRTISTAILGFTSPDQFETNLLAVDIQLSKEESASLDKVSHRDLLYPQNFLARFAQEDRVKAIQ